MLFSLRSFIYQRVVSFERNVVARVRNVHDRYKLLPVTQRSQILAEFTSQTNSNSAHHTFHHKTDRACQLQCYFSHDLRAVT